MVGGRVFVMMKELVQAATKKMVAKKLKQPPVLRREIIFPKPNEPPIIVQAGVMFFPKERRHRSIFLRPTNSLAILQQDFWLIHRNPIVHAIDYVTTSLRAKMYKVSHDFYGIQLIEFRVFWDFENDPVPKLVLNPELAYDKFKKAVQNALPPNYKINSFHVFAIGSFNQINESVRNEMSKAEYMWFMNTEGLPNVADWYIEKEMLQWEREFDIHLNTNRRGLALFSSDDDLHPLVEREKIHGYYTLTIGRKNFTGANLKKTSHQCLIWEDVLK